MSKIRILGLGILMSGILVAPAHCEDEEVKPPVPTLSGRVSIEQSGEMKSLSDVQSGITNVDPIKNSDSSGKDVSVPRGAPTVTRVDADSSKAQVDKQATSPSQSAALSFPSLSKQHSASSVTHLAKQNNAVPKIEGPIDFHQYPFRFRHLQGLELARAVQDYKLHAQNDPLYLRRPLVAQLQHNDTADDKPYRWSQNFAGGYSDMTGHIKEIVWGDKLASYGGRFFDGTPVPKGPVTINKMGHIWWQPDLSPVHFVRRETTNL